MRRALLLAVLLTLTLTGEAQAVQLVNPDGTPSPYQRWVDRMRVPTVRVRLIVNGDISACFDAALACTAETPPGATISLAPTGPQPRDPTAMQFALAHELGHQFAGRLFADADRSAYEAIAGYPAIPWLGCEIGPQPPPADCSRYRWSPQESFANAYADCAQAPDAGVSVVIAPARKARICALIRAVAAAHPDGVDPPSKHRRSRHGRRHHRRATSHTRNAHVLRRSR